MSKRPPAGRGPGFETRSPQRPFTTLLDLSNRPVLPPVAVGTSHNYGATGPTALPREAELDPIQDVMGVVRRINTGLDESEQRISLSRNGSAASSRRGSIVTSRRTKREPTPDDQLLNGLREVTESPNREVHSDRTPSPPIPRAVSTDSSPDIPPPERKNSLISVIANSPMYPKPLQQPLQRLRSFLTGDGPGDSSPHRESSVDNASELSFELERTIHDDELQRTRPSGHGSNLSKAPRRPSGVQIQPTIEEEDEPSSVLTDESDSGNPVPQTWTAEARTVFPSRFQSELRSEPSFDEPILQDPGQFESSSNSESYGRSYLHTLSKAATGGFNWIGAHWIQAAGVLCLSFLLFCACQGDICETLRLVDPFPDLPDISPNTSEPTAVGDLRRHMSSMNRQISSLSRELKSARSEQRGAVGYPTNMPYNQPFRPMDLNVNFLSPSHGAMIDPEGSSVSASKYDVKPAVLNHDGAPIWLRATRFMLSPFKLSLGQKMKAVHPHSAVLLPWEEAGDCWCSVKEPQLSVYLGRAIVPEEFVIEHIPMTATLDPTSAPKVVETWARFIVVDSNDDHHVPEPSSRFSWMSPWGSGRNHPQSKKPVRADKQSLGHYNLPGKASLADVVMESLKVSNPYDDPETYSNDPLLGPNFYRVGRAFYDIHDLNYRQAFTLSPIIDVPTIRVDKVVFRVKDNWGSDQTCIYRLKLHGHL